VKKSFGGRRAMFWLTGDRRFLGRPGVRRLHLWEGSAVFRPEGAAPCQPRPSAWAAGSRMRQRSPNGAAPTWCRPVGAHALMEISVSQADGLGWHRAGPSGLKAAAAKAGRPAGFWNRPTFLKVWRQAAWCCQQGFFHKLSAKAAFPTAVFHRGTLLSRKRKAAEWVSARRGTASRRPCHPSDRTSPAAECFAGRLLGKPAFPPSQSRPRAPQANNRVSGGRLSAP
jgi:hypothetical protein